LPLGAEAADRGPARAPVERRGGRTRLRGRGGRLPRGRARAPLRPEQHGGARAPGRERGALPRGAEALRHARRRAEPPDPRGGAVIARYTRPEMGSLWTDEARYRAW